MKIKISKKEWLKAGKHAGWVPRDPGEFSDQDIGPFYDAQEEEDALLGPEEPVNLEADNRRAYEDGYQYGLKNRDTLGCPYGSHSDRSIELTTFWFDGHKDAMDGKASKYGFKKPITAQKFGEPAVYTYWINLDERGSFRADVRNSNGKTIFNILAGDELGPDESSIFEDGWMKHKNDLEGLREYLVHLGIMSKETKLVDGIKSEDEQRSKDYYKQLRKDRMIVPPKPL